MFPNISPMAFLQRRARLFRNGRKNEKECRHSRHSFLKRGEKVIHTAGQQRALLQGGGREIKREGKKGKTTSSNFLLRKTEKICPKGFTKELPLR